MEPRRVSVVVVSRERPAALSRCLTGLAQLDYPLFEVLVVACPSGLAAVEAHPQAAAVKTVAYDQPNISAARNRGIVAAAGEIVAFIDDDAVPEPSWLARLTAPFDDPEVAASGGFVIGRNGFSLQHGAATVDATGETHPLRLDGDAALVLHPRADRAIKTEGTCMALRREVLSDLGGFDPAFHFYLDETDLNMRLARTRRATAIVPLARVHHGMAPSARRHGDRTPRDLSEIGASQVVFLRRHAPLKAHDAALDRLRTEQRRRLLRAMQAGPLDPLDVARLMRVLEAGIAAGAARDLPRLGPLPRAAEGFRPFPGRPGAAHRLLAGRPWSRATLERDAKRALAEGETVTILTLSPTALYHRLRFSGDGLWRQTGGLFGRAERDEPLLRMTSFRRRKDREAQRLSRFRNIR